MTDGDHDVDLLVREALRSAPAPAPIMPPADMRDRVEGRANVLRRRARTRGVLVGTAAAGLLAVAALAFAPRRQGSLDLLGPDRAGLTTPATVGPPTTTVTVPQSPTPPPVPGDEGGGAPPAPTAGDTPAAPGSPSATRAPDPGASPTTAAPTPAGPTETPACRPPSTVLVSVEEGTDVVLRWEHRSGPACRLTGPPAVTPRSSTGWAGTTFRPPAGVGTGEFLVGPGQRAALRLRPDSVPSCSGSHAILYFDVAVAGTSFLVAHPGLGYFCPDAGSPTWIALSFTPA